MREWYQENQKHTNTHMFRINVVTWSAPRETKCSNLAAHAFVRKASDPGIVGGSIATVPASNRDTQPVSNGRFSEAPVTSASSMSVICIDSPQTVDWQPYVGKVSRLCVKNVFKPRSSTRACVCHLLSRSISA